MKKLFTLLISTFIIGSVFAQSAFVNPRPVFNHAITITSSFHHYDEHYSFTPLERDFKIQMINQEYNNALEHIFKMHFVSRREKARLIRRIENKRAEQIKSVNERFNDYRNKYNDEYYDNNFEWRK
jgi:hypothetical protein